MDILKLHLKKSAGRVLDTDSDPKHSSKTVAKLCETTMSEYPSGCQKEPDLNPKRKAEDMRGNSQACDTGSIRMDESVYEKPFVKMGSLQERMTLNSMC